MKERFVHLGSTYLLSAWIPATLVLGMLGLMVVDGVWLRIPYLGVLLLVGVGTGLLGMLVATIAQFTKGHKVRGVISLVSLPIVGLVVVNGVGFLVVRAMFSEEPDNFGKDIVIPATMQITDPVESFEKVNEEPVDDFTTEIVAAFSTNTNGNHESEVSIDLAVLNEFATTNRQKLIEYLSANPRWFVTEENGKPYAYRRFVVAGQLQNSLNGFYTSHNLAAESQVHFQTRIVIGFDGPVFANPFRNIITDAKVDAGKVKLRVIDDKRFDQGKESYLVLRGSRAALEIFEQSRLDGRPATALALKEVKRELEAALAGPGKSKSTEQFSRRTSEPEIQLANGMQGGIYHVRALVNPGQAGRVYLKAFEATMNTPLSADRLKPRSTARIGWSSDRAEKFLYQCEITIYEGDWGTFYPARFEVWFTPDSGSAERKLIERIFRIEGWMR